MSVSLLAAHPLVHLNAGLNTVATVLLLVGLWLIKGGRERAHGRAMMTAFVVSIAFLVSYLTYHSIAGHVPFTHQGWPRTIYLAVLATHIPLAMCVPPLAILTIVFGWRAAPGSLTTPRSDDPSESAARTAAARKTHRRLARVTFPIWLYVSVSGVVVYLMLYHLYPSDSPSQPPMSVSVRPLGWPLPESVTKIE